jgi:Spy/CpxP family protein refolding chaperone
MTRYSWLTAAAGCLLVTYATTRAETISEIVKRVKPAVVEIVALNRKGAPMKIGTGFFVSPDGQVITNFHVIDGASSVVAFDSLGARLSLERVMSEKDQDPFEPDLALLKFQVKDVPFLKLRQTDDISEGDKVIVIGNPAGLTSTVSDGIISAFRKNRLGDRLIQITAPISPGSSGSPVLDEKGEVIGIVTLTNNQGQNLNFAITSQDIYVKRALVWNREHPEGVDLLAKLPSMMSSAQYDNARSIIEKYLADRLAVRNDPALDVAAKKAKLDQLGQEYDADISAILTREQKERLAAEEAAKKRAAGAK